VLAGVIMICANIFDFIDGKVAYITGRQSEFGAFWDSTLDRFSDLALFTGLIWLYSKLGRTDYVLITTLTLIFSIMTSYARARAECMIEKCKVGFMERPERIVLFMIGAFTNRMAGVLWVILVLSILSVANRIQYTHLILNKRPDAIRHICPSILLARRTHHHSLRSLGDRDSGVCLVDAARLAKRSNGGRPAGPYRMDSINCDTLKLPGGSPFCAACCDTPLQHRINGRRHTVQPPYSAISPLR
jgi:CDP-diacylglycerol--glycerol-3-phosphate 3-phosphatidyltransferase